METATTATTGVRLWRESERRDRQWRKKRAPTTTAVTDIHVTERERDGKSEDVAAAEIAPTDFVSLKKNCLCRRESGKLESITATEKGIAMCVLSISNKNLVHFRALENSA